MKKFLSCFTISAAMFLCVNAQTDIQTCILTDRGLITVSKAANGRDMVMISIACWDKMMAGTKFISRNLPGYRGKKLCIEIADCKKGKCKKGIGFGCSIFDCPYVPDRLPNRVDDENRICAITISKLKGSIKIVFNDNVNWESLEKY